jgi:hypothetical protein
MPPDDPLMYKGSCLVGMIANTWDRPVTISAEHGAEALDISRSVYIVDRRDGKNVYTLLDGPLPVGEVAVVFLAHDPLQAGGAVLCPEGTIPAIATDPFVHGTGRTKAIHLHADAPVAAYSQYPYGGADSFFPSATLLLPVSSWETDYVAVSPFDFGSTQNVRNLQIIANEDDTEVTMRPTVDVRASSGVAGAAAGVVNTWTLSRGEVLQFTQTALTGSPIVSNKPIGMFGGSACTQLPTPFCDFLQQQIAPFSQWGTEYAMVPYAPRSQTRAGDFREIVPYSLVGAVDGTELEYFPSKPADAPSRLQAGESGNFYTDQLFVVRSQDSKHPFHASVYMTGSTWGNGTGNGTSGDPDFVNVPPGDQFLDHYVFFTDHTFASTTLTVVRRKTAKGFMPVELGCAGEIRDFQPVGTDGTYEFAWVTLTDGFVGKTYEKGTCGYGRQEARSDGPFAITVWGTGLDASYGYVAGTGLRPINDAPPPLVR